MHNYIKNERSKHDLNLGKITLPTTFIKSKVVNAIQISKHSVIKNYYLYNYWAYTIIV